MEYIWNGITFDSQEEVEFAYWLEELKQAGYVSDWDRSQSYQLTAGLKHTYKEHTQLKTKVKVEQKSQTIFQPSYYTPDFEVVWMYPVKDLFHTFLNTPSKLSTVFISQEVNDKYFSIIEIKPSFDFKNMTRGFELNRKFMWEKYKLYVNLIHIDKLFDKTFTPALSMFTPTGKPRKITKWTPRTLNQFVHDKK